MRNPVACISCRSSKAKCIHAGSPPCEKCEASGRAEACQFPAPGTSSQHRLPKRKREDEHADAESPALQLPGSTPIQAARDRPTPAQETSTPARKKESKPANVKDVLKRIPQNVLFSEECRDVYFRAFGGLGFAHKPRVLKELREEKVERWLLLAMLAFCSRFTKTKLHTFDHETFAQEARTVIQSEIGTPTLSKIQTLCILVTVDWGCGESQRAWLYLGFAITMVKVMGFCSEEPVPSREELTRKERILREEKRRTVWYCFLLDRQLACCKGRTQGFRTEDMKIQLPCEEDDYVFGTEVSTKLLTDLPNERQSILENTMRAAELWGRVCHYKSSTGRNRLQPVLEDLSKWLVLLPPRHTFDGDNILANYAIDQGPALFYMHSIYLAAIMQASRDLYDPEGPSKDAEVECEPFKVDAVRTCVLIGNMGFCSEHTLKTLTPWMGYCVFTAVGWVLYSRKFYGSKEAVYIMMGCKVLKDMQKYWPIARHWLDTLQVLHRLYQFPAKESNGNAVPSRSKDDIGPRVADAINALASSSYERASSSSPAPHNLSPTESSHSRAEGSPEEDQKLAGCFNANPHIKNLSYDELLRFAKQNFFKSTPADSPMAVPQHVDT